MTNVFSGLGASVTPNLPGAIDGAIQAAIAKEEEAVRQVALHGDVSPEAARLAIISVTRPMCEETWPAPEMLTRGKDTYRQHRCGRYDLHTALGCICRYCGKKRSLLSE